MKKRNLSLIFNILTFIGVLVLNFLATSLPLNNLSTREISDSFDIYFVPAGYVFSIWGLIYLGLLAFLVLQALPAQRDNEKLMKIDFWFVLSNFANALWLVSFHYQRFILALFFMLVLLVSLINIFLRLEIGKNVGNTSWKWMVEIPFSIYLGWITVATIANVTQVLYFINWNGFGIAPEIWYVVMVIAAVIISSLMSITRRNIPFTLVLVWAFVGIAVKFPDVPLVYDFSWIGASATVAVMILALVIQPTRKKT